MFQGFVGIAGLIASAVASPVLEPTPLEDESYAETFTAVASLDDGSFVLVQLLFTNAGFGDGKGACRALWVPPGGAGINANANVDHDEWSYNPAKDTLNVGPCQLGKSGGGLRFSASLSDLSVSLQIQGTARSVQPPDHRIDVGGEFHETDILVPRADVKATVSAGGRTLVQNGAVHLDHTRSNTLLPNVAGCWLRLRGFSGADPALLQVRIPPQGRRAKAWVWPLSSGVPSAVDASSVQVGKTGAGLPQLAVGAYTVKSTARVYRYRPTEAYGVLGTLAAPWIGDPTTTTYHARASGPEGTEIQGILEVLEVVENACRVQ